jgi:hypothetical protein
MLQQGLKRGAAVQLPADLNDIEWEDFENGIPKPLLKQLRSRVLELSSSILAAAIADERLSIEVGGDLALQLADSIHDRIQRIEFLQYALSSIVLAHSDWDYVPQELTSLMLKILETVQQQSLENPAALQQAAQSWVTDFGMTEFPIALTATFALVPSMGKDADRAISTFVSCWNSRQKSEIELEDPNDWDIFEWTLPDIAPLAAILSLTASEDSALLKKLFRLTVDGAYPEYSFAFWEYVCGYLVEDRDGEGFWSPSEAWLSGFFRHLPSPSALPGITPEATYRALKFFWENLEALELTNAHGESTVAPHVGALLAVHPLADHDLRVHALEYLQENGQAVTVFQRPSLFGKVMAFLSSKKRR